MKKDDKSYHYWQSIVPQCNPLPPCSHCNINISWHVFCCCVCDQKLTILTNTVLWSSKASIPISAFTSLVNELNISDLSVKPFY